MFTDPAKRKLFFTVLALSFLGIFVAVLITGKGRGALNAEPTIVAQEQTDGASTPATESSTPAAQAGLTATPEAAPAVAPLSALTARPLGNAVVNEPLGLGSLPGQGGDEVLPFRIEFARTSAGIRSIIFNKYFDATAVGGIAREPYAVTRESSIGAFEVPVFAARQIIVNGTSVPLFGVVWYSPSAGRFESEIVDASGAVIATIVREYRSTGTNYDLTLLQSVTNRSAAPLNVRFEMYGPSDLPIDHAAYTETRRMHFGYILPQKRDPQQATVLANGQMFERQALIDLVNKGDSTLWPDTTAKEGEYALSWVGTTNRYFTLALYAPYAPPTSPSKKMSSIDKVDGGTTLRADGTSTLFTTLWTPATTIAPNASASFDMGIYAGPLEPRILEAVNPYAALNMGDLIIYSMAGCCSFCTFPWLARSLLWVLTTLHDYILFDWGFSIIALTIIVRLILHPVTKKSQISMQRFSKAMSALKPELDALQKRYKDEPARMQQEQIRMFREKGVSPAGCVGGMLPTFLQMPIWMALYAVLYFAIALRQEPAFFGIFQEMGGWSFLADLSSADRFYVFGTPLNLYFFSMPSINVLPIMMGFVFWVQAKYMTPPPSATMTDEQKSQQRMMQIMMTAMFPIMLYTAPSGLTLYIFTSTCFGIMEGRIIKKQVAQMDLLAPTAKKKQDFMGRLYEKALERAKQKPAPDKRFKDR
ncbi:MAG: membrane protein insertase YidC [Phycisphaerales bacterium]|nr:membrane protein insertase YidC [Phycisphaerales bacterium]